jgi:hypothetical protein
MAITYLTLVVFKQKVLLISFFLLKKVIGVTEGAR